MAAQQFSDADIKNYIDNLLKQKGDAAASDIAAAMNKYGVPLERVASVYNMSSAQAASWLNQRGVNPATVPHQSNLSGSITNVASTQQTTSKANPITQASTQQTTPKANPISDADIKNYIDNLLKQKGDGAASDIAAAMNKYGVPLERVASVYNMSPVEAALWLKQRGVDPATVPYQSNLREFIINVASTQQTTPKVNPIAPEEARNLIEQSMLTGVPTATFNEYGGYDKVYQLAQQAGLKGSPRTGLIVSAAPTIKNTGIGNLSYAFDYSYTKHPAQITKEQFFEFAVPREYIQYIPDYVDDYASLAALAIANDPENRNKTFDEIDWSFLKPKLPQMPTLALPQMPTLAQYNAVTREVNPETDTVQGQLKKILDEDDSPLMRRARAMALAQMAGRGLLNSSLAATAGYAAMIDKALPIAQQDAQTYFTQGLKNQDYRNQAELTNVNWKNEFLKSAYVTQLDFWKQSNILGLQQKYNLETMQYENQLKSDLLRLEYGFKNDLQRSQLDADVKNIYLSTYKDLLNQLNAILVDPNTDDAAKKSMVNNYIKAIEKMRNSLRAIGQDVPDFDFSDYYPVDPNTDDAANSPLVDPNTGDAAKRSTVHNSSWVLDRMGA